MTDDPPRDFRRPKVPPPHVRAQTKVPAVPVELCDEVTGKHSSEDELHEWRAKRSPDARLEKVEAKHDGLALVVARMDGKLDTLVKSAEAATTEREKRAAADERERDSKRKHTIALITALGVAVGGIITAAVASGVVR